MNNLEGSIKRSLRIRLFVKKIQKGLSFLTPRGGGGGGSTHALNKEMEVAKIIMVPEDVKEGHFVVLAAKDEETQRFVVELGFLANPAFLSLLEEAEEEYGFKQNGALIVPCRPRVLQKILEDRCQVGAAILVAPACNVILAV